MNRLEERQAARFALESQTTAAITELALILNPETPSPGASRYPKGYNEAMIVNAWLKVNEIHFMNQFGKRRSRYSWKDIAIISAVVLIVGGFVVGLTSLFLDTLGPECLVIHCVKVIR